jgi:hypothetical protein
MLTRPMRRFATSSNRSSTRSVRRRDQHGMITRGKVSMRAVALCSNRLARGRGRPGKTVAQQGQRCAQRQKHRRDHQQHDVLHRTNPKQDVGIEPDHHQRPDVGRPCGDELLPREKRRQDSNRHFHIHPTSLHAIPGSRPSVRSAIPASRPADGAPSPSRSLLTERLPVSP